MALKPTIYKFDIAIADLDRNIFENIALTVAQHPSESAERMMARVLAFCLHTQDHLAFTKGLSATDEPDIAMHSLSGENLLWIDVGEPAVERIKKAARVSKAVYVYSFNSKSDVWWSQSRDKFAQLKVAVRQFKWPEIQLLASKIERTMSMSVTLTEGSAYFATDLGECELSVLSLQEL